MEADDNGTSQGTQHTPLPLSGADDQDNGLEIFGPGSFEEFSHIDLGGLFDPEHREQEAADGSRQSCQTRGGPPSTERQPRPSQTPQQQQQQSGAATATGRAGRRPKAPKPPKKPLSAYNWFFKTIRPSLIQELGGEARFDQLGRLVGERWRNLSNEQKQEFEAMADRDVLRFRREMAEHDRERRRRQSEIQQEQQRRAREARARIPPTVVRVDKFPAPPPGRYLGPPPPELSLEYQGRQITLADRFGQERTFTIRYACYSVKRSDLDAYLSQLTEQTHHHTPPSRRPGLADISSIA
mmetsp:Transcript_1965/g.3983  ORF Transcript_1965/g.3983 Transcript_1965/m.3983 type:complete len:297 (+) Transcript_1965:329-1219(+)|eukprot:CAMPEP_0168745822 /NCGR_PEP_ID=MMETSP0724-20121128/14819_1 /TAXON_ID=265536 /ORGANISM="Amphiprora sp., Strain CCMP467" /LENGTH=296 /DNA_ID=CAMNT_0008793553 /DNA_START=284 /DNA_END=1174 /DNA_ORIENTATION=+